MAVKIYAIPPHPYWPRSQQQYMISIDSSTHVETLITTVTACAHTVHRWVEEGYRLLRQHLLQMDILFPHHNNKVIVGVAVQWNPMGGRRAATLQLCFGNQCLLYHLHHTTVMPGNLRDLFISPSIAFFCLQCPRQMHQLISRAQLGVNFDEDGNMPVNLRPYLHLHNPPRGWCAHDSPIRFLAHVFLDLDCCRFYPEDDPRVSRSDWEVQTLSLPQIIYASLVPFVSSCLGRRASTSTDGVFRVLKATVPSSWMDNGH